MKYMSIYLDDAAVAVAFCNHDDDAKNADGGALMPAELTAALQIAATAYRAIEEMGDKGLSEGTLYAVMMIHVSASQFAGMVNLLMKEGLVRRDNGRLFAMGVQ